MQDKELAQNKCNKSHAVAYATLCYLTAYYKTYYPVEYLCAEFTNIYTNTASDKRKDKLIETIKECRRLGIKFKGPEVGKSKWKFTIEDNEIRIGLCAISSFGYKAYEALDYCLAQECNPTLEDVYENINKTTCNKKAFNALIFSGAFGDRSENYKKYCELREEEQVEEIVFHKNLRINIYEDDKDIEEKILGYNFVHSLANTLKPIGFNRIRNNSIFNTKAIITRVKKQRDKNKKMMAFLTIETGDGAIDTVVFSNVYDKYKKFMKKDLLIDIKAKKSNNDDCILLEVH